MPESKVETSAAESPKNTTTTVLLLRHGTTPTTGKELPGRAPGLELSETGRTQVKAAGDHIAQLHQNGRRIGAIYASPLERTMQTAQAVADATGLAVQPMAGLLELDIGEWTGLSFKEATQRPEWGRIQLHPSGFRFPGGESFLEMQARIIGALDEIRAAHPGETVVAVSHADPIRALLAHLLGIHLDLFQRTVVSPASLSIVAYGDGGPMVLAVNTATELFGFLGSDDG